MKPGATTTAASVAATAARIRRYVSGKSSFTTSSRESTHWVGMRSHSSFLARMRVERSSPKVTFSSAGAASIAANRRITSAEASACSSPVNRRRTMARCRSISSASRSRSPSAQASSPSVQPLMAELTSTTRPPSRASPTMSSTRDMLVASATDEPPNFKTLKPIAVSIH